MLTNYLKLAWRNLVKNKVHSLIIISGLALAYSACLIIFLFVRVETSYDRQAVHHDRLYRVVKDFVHDDGSFLPDATTPPAIAPALAAEIPQIESVLRLFPAWGDKALVRNGDISFYEPRVYRADSNLFDFFAIPMLEGDPRVALSEPKNVVITKSMSRKYFGDQPALGKNLELGAGDGRLRVVTGVIDDLPSNIHFHFDFVLPNYDDIDANWGWYNFYTYIRLKEGATIDEVNPKIVAVYKKNRPQGSARYYSQAVPDIHLTSKLKWELEPNGDQTLVTIFITVAIFILLIASVNYINLSVVQSLNRSREVGIRKVAGANSMKLINQFLTESICMSLFSLVLAVAIAEALLPYFNVAFNQHLGSLLSLPIQIQLLGVLAALLTGAISGLYPSLYLAAFKPAQVLKGIFQPTSRNLWLRKSLVVLQFSISIALITGAIIVFRQVDFVKSRELGFDREQIIVVQNVGDVENKESLRLAMGDQPGVSGVGTSNGVLGGQNWTTGLVAKGNEHGVLVNITAIDYDYIPTMGLAMVEGRNFTKGTDIPTRRGGKVVLNERAVKDLGIVGDPIGTLVTEDPDADTVQYFEVIGVARDFHFASLKSEIKPYAFYLAPDRANNFVVKLGSNNVQATLASVEQAWKSVAPTRPFEYFFLGDSIDALYSTEDNFILVFSILTAMAIYIACSGLFAIASYLIKRRTKEIGIRKVLGASSAQVIWLVSFEFIIIVLIANVIAWPLAYRFMDTWLAGFAYRIPLSWSYFTVAGIAALIIALATVGFKSLQAAMANPVDALRNE